MKPAIFHLDAEAELWAALDYYRRKQARLARKFRWEFEKALGRIRENPLAYAADEETGVRLCPLHRFPFNLVYLDFEDHIWVAALAHQRRRPGYWSRRRPE